MNDNFYSKYRAEEIKNTNKKGATKRGDEGGVSKAFYNDLRAASVEFSPNPKIEWVVNKIRENHKTLVYSSFLDWGVNKIKEALGKDTKSYTITGETSKSKRQEIVNKYNNDKSGINLLFITKAGGEGLDLKKVKNVIIFERNWNKGVEDQVIGRAVRFRSHTDLPLKDQVVNVYFVDLKKPSVTDRKRIIESYNKNHIINKLYLERLDDDKESLTVDEIMEKKGAEKYLRIKAFMDWLTTISIGSKSCKSKF